MNDEHSLRRMAGDYEIIQAIHIGDREIVLGEKPQSESGDKYMCAFCQQNELFAAYSEVMCSDNYAEMVKMFGERVTEQAEKTRVAMNKPKIQGIDDHPLTASDCTVLSYDDDLNNKIVVIKPEVLRREYSYLPVKALHRRIWCLSSQPWFSLLLHRPLYRKRKPV